jgi:hypothetical protein
MHAGVRATGDGKLVEATERRTERVANDAFDSPQLGLCGPAAEARAVVFDR